MSHIDFVARLVARKTELEGPADDHDAPTDNQESTAISLGEFGRDVERRRQIAGTVDVPRNAGNHSTASKRALLKAIEDAGGKW